MMKTGSLLALLMIMISVTAFGQRDRKGDDTEQQVSTGILYSLPRTGIRIHVKATREQFFHGPYYQYSKALLGLDNAPASDYVKWKITGISIETFSEPDPSAVYTVKGKAASLIHFNSLGIPDSDVANSGAKEGPLNVSSFIDNADDVAYPFTDLSLQSFTVKPDSVSKNVIVTKSLEEKAREAAHTITKLRKRRFKTLANAYDTQLPDGKSYQVMVDELSKLEANYVALFIGKSISRTYDYSFDYIPGNQSVSGDVVFRFSTTGGVMSKNNLSGKPVVINLKKENSLAEAQQKQKSSIGGTTNNGLYYRMPGMASLQILDGVNLMAECRLAIDQYGTLVPVADQMLDLLKHISYYPATGALELLNQK